MIGWMVCWELIGNVQEGSERGMNSIFNYVEWRRSRGAVVIGLIAYRLGSVGLQLVKCTNLNSVGSREHSQIDLRVQSLEVPFENSVEERYMKENSKPTAEPQGNSGTHCDFLPFYI